MLVLLSGALATAQGQSKATAKPKTAATDPSQIPPPGKDDLISPEDLVKVLQANGPKPLILSVGPRMLYMQAHIVGAELIGPASEPSGTEALKQRVKALPKTQPIVIYCGCCPWSHCPNLEPAYKQLRALGFTKIKVLFIPTNFGVDWVYKGYPTVRG
jgi:hypothetical protein